MTRRTAAPYSVRIMFSFLSLFAFGLSAVDPLFLKMVGQWVGEGDRLFPASQRHIRYGQVSEAWRLRMEHIRELALAREHAMEAANDAS